jgi:hypothetical protein
LLRIASIVEGHGEVQAVPLLVRRIAGRLTPIRPVVALRPIRIPRNRLLRSGELERAIDLAALQTTPEDGILVLIDADQDCPKELGPRLLSRAGSHRRDRRIRVVLAKAEYESWFLAAADSLGAGQKPAEVQLLSDPEAVRDAKGKLGRLLGWRRSYRETLDQPALTVQFDLEQARMAPSFDKLWRDMASLLGA